MNEIDFSNEHDLGYRFYPSDIPNHLGHPRLDVVFTDSPTRRHFDPLHASYPVASFGGVDRLVVCHPWSAGRRYKVCAGRIAVADRVGKVVEAFSLGGDLQIVSKSERTICGLVSPAPIFSLYKSFDLNMCLTAEMEILLAQQKAHWNPAHPHAYEEHLARVDPLELYACILDALQKKGSHIHSGSSEFDCDVRHFVDVEISRLKECGSWPQEVCTPAQLLSDSDQ